MAKKSGSWTAPNKGKINGIPEQAWKAEAQFGRTPVGNSMPKDAVPATARDTGRQPLKRKTGNAKGGSIGPATANHRSGVPQERLGPRFSVGVALPGPESVEARETQANGRIVPAVMGSKNNFWDQARVYGSR